MKKFVIAIVVLAILAFGAWHIYVTIETNRYVETRKEYDRIHNISQDEGTSIRYKNNQVLILFSGDVTQERKLEIVQEIGGPSATVGELDIDSVTIPPQNSLEELESYCKTLMDRYREGGEVFGITYTMVNDLRINFIKPNDSWSVGTTWREDKPSGSNWWLEAVQVPSAWEYNERFDEINIGIIDGGFDTNHEDVQIEVINDEINDQNDWLVDWSVKGGEILQLVSHGTHVAGTIGATPNNGKGVTGIVWKSNLFGADNKLTPKQEKKGIQLEKTLPELGENEQEPMVIYATRLLKEKNVKVINVSMGAGLENEERVEKQGRYFSFFVAYWIEKYKDFLVVQAAGNDGIDARFNSNFASITIENAQRTIDEHGQNSSITAQDIMDRVIVVGGVAKANKNYKLWKGSNYGSQISIVAPGEKVYSAVKSGRLTGSYGNKTGTSMSAPIVTGVASLVWAVKGNQFTSGEVKDIVCNFTKETVAPNNKQDNRTYRMVNAKLAVEEALRRVYGELPTVSRTDPKENHDRFEEDNGATQPQITPPRQENTQQQPSGDSPEGYTSIYTAQDLDNIRNNLSGNYILMNDIDLSTYANWIPIGDKDTPFSGMLDGNSYIIKNMTVNVTDTEADVYAGLFGYINSATIQNTGMVNSKVNAKIIGDTYSAYAGGIAGYNSSSVIDNCYNTGDIDATSGTAYVGGIVGYNYSFTYNNSSTLIINCYNKGIVSAAGPTTKAGGIAGANENSVIASSYNDGKINASGDEYSSAFVGGIVGSSSILVINDCYNVGEISATSGGCYVGGIVGHTSSKLQSCYNIGTVKGIATSPYQAIYSSNHAGGIWGFNSVYGSGDCYYLNNIDNESGEELATNILPLTSNQMKQQSSYVGFDFITVWAISPSINNGYPYLRGMQP